MELFPQDPDLSEVDAVNKMLPFKIIYLIQYNFIIRFVQDNVVLV